MISLWIGAALVSALAGFFVIWRSASTAARAGRLASAEGDPTLGVYRRQLAEIDDLAEEGLLPPSELRSARAEAARRLLKAGEDQADQPDAKAPSAGARRLVLACAALAPLAAMGIYLLVGSPGARDLPFAPRLAAWSAQAKTEPQVLTPPQVLAILTKAAQDNPKQAAPLYDLAMAEAMSGDLPSAEHDLRKALALDPASAELWKQLGLVQTARANGTMTPDAVADFRRAHALDPTDQAVRYALARSEIGAGQIDAGVADLRALAADLKPDDPARALIARDADVAARTRALPVDPETAQGNAQDGAQDSVEAPAGQPDQAAFIHAMVDRLAQRLQQSPNDPNGWARLVHAYGVLGDKPDQAAALARARAEFAGRPDVVKAIEAAAG